MAQGLDAIEDKLKGLQDFKANAEKIAVDGLMEEQAVVLDMIFEEQLYTLGINGADVPIMDYKPYAPATVWYKQMKGQPYDRVTLRDSGDFHSAGHLERISDTEAQVGSTDPKADSLEAKYDRRIFWLTKDNLQETRDFYIKPYMQDKIREI